MSCLHFYSQFSSFLQAAILAAFGSIWSLYTVNVSDMAISKVAECKKDETEKRQCDKAAGKKEGK